MDLHLFIPITKIDVAKRLVYGTIAEEIPDKSDEIMDYETAKPAFAAWSADIAKASAGKSQGNLRAMHGNVAAGRLDQILFDDAARRISTVAKVVDDAEWKKVLEGVYTGFSMGGKYKKRWRDPEQPSLTRYTPEPTEVSLVDNPCIPSATFEVVKDDGTVELRKFKQARKYGARHSQEDLARVQLMHDTAVALGADCADDPDQPLDDSKLAFARLEHHALRKALDTLTPKLDALVRRIEALEALPVPGGPVARTLAISKAHDIAGGILPGDAAAAFEKHLASLSPEQRAHALTKLALKNPLSR